MIRNHAVNKRKTVRCFLLFSIIAFSFLSSCKKEKNNPGLFYGQWKTSYGDTITFTSENGKDILYRSISASPSPGGDLKSEFRYVNDKLEIRQFIDATEFSRLETFKWNELNQSFEVKGVEWFLFISSTTTMFTFTRI